VFERHKLPLGVLLLWIIVGWIILRAFFAGGDAYINTAEGIHFRLRVFLRVHRGPNRGNLQFYVSFFAFYHNNGSRWLEKIMWACLNKRKSAKDICEANT